MERSTIIHVDMDAFYAAVEVVDLPELAGKPVIVGGSRVRGVVSSATYEARAFGVRSAMPIAEALRLCPGAVCLPVRMDRYKEFSRRIFSVFQEYTPAVEPLSVDEAFLDVAGCERLFGPAPDIAKAIRRRISDTLGLTASAGVAPTKLVAKIASDTCKPDGLCVVEPHEVLSFLEPLPVTRLWGVGPATHKKLRAMGVSTIGEVRRLDHDLLVSSFGKAGEAIFRFCRGQDSRPVHEPVPAKSIGAERTFDQDLTTEGEARSALRDLCHKVGRRLRRSALWGNTVNLKVKYHDFVQVTRAATLGEPTDDPDVLFSTVCQLLAKTEVGRRRVRLLGVAVSQLVEPAAGCQLDLFSDPEAAVRKRRLYEAIDRISDKYGNGAVRPASTHE